MHKAIQNQASQQSVFRGIHPKEEGNKLMVSITHTNICDTKLSRHESFYTQQYHSLTEGHESTPVRASHRFV
jgi:D-arabinose 1-dehydrogenase-like Zn-dependent alcohol dehydrogenase